VVNDIIPSHILMHKFLSMLLIGQNNRIILGYKLEDVFSWDHLFQQGMFDLFSSGPKIGYVVIQ
jgi:hypothetical protein